MGGLVSRSALFYGNKILQSWIHVVENMVCIGSPHHGVALERFGFPFAGQTGTLPIRQNYWAYRQHSQQRYFRLTSWQCARR